MDTLDDTKKIDQGDRSVITMANGLFDVTLEIKYYDWPLASQAEKERLELESKKVNPRGL